METIIKCKKYKTNDLMTFGKDLYFGGGLNDYKTIRVSSDIYEILTSYLKSLIKDCKQHNIKIEISNTQSNDYITVFYETKVFCW